MIKIFKIIIFFIKFIFIAFLVGVIGSVAGLVFLSHEISNKSLPSVQTLRDYSPPVVSRVYANDGSLIAEFSREKRLYLPIANIPDKIIYAFVSAEDKNFFAHGGIDYLGIVKATIRNARTIIEGTGRKLSGASTITQQVSKNFLLSSERTFTRKLKELLLSYRIESTFSKYYILELYLNKIYFGMGAYGIAAASVDYFGKSLEELELHQVAYLAALPKGPNNYHPKRNVKRAIARRNWVLREMYENKYITYEEYKNAISKKLDTNLFSLKADVFAGEYFSEGVRRKLFQEYGEKILYEAGLSIHTSLVPELQIMARRVLRENLYKYDVTLGWPGPHSHIQEDMLMNWQQELAKIVVPSDVSPWKVAVVLRNNRKRSFIGIADRNASQDMEFSTGSITLDDIKRYGVQIDRKISQRKQIKIQNVADLLNVGDVVFVKKISDNTYSLRHIPDVNGGLIVMNQHTGQVYAMVGGFSYDISEFNRAMQARRQPGSIFKPFVYLAALENGYTPSSLILDAPFVIEQTGNNDLWRPKNFGNIFYGPSTLRLGIERSRNVMTVRLAQEIGLRNVVEYGQRFDVFDDALAVPSIALGTVETTLDRITAGFAMIANGGKRVKANLINRIQDRRGKIIYKQGLYECVNCKVKGRIDTNNLPDEPDLIDTRERVVDSFSSYQMISMLEGVVKRGTAKIISELNLVLAGKTGTTNDERDSWFIGFSPEITVGVFIGFDKPRHMGKDATGGKFAAPVFKDFMQQYYKGREPLPFTVPSGLNFFRINAKTGSIASLNDKNTILEAFKPNTRPPKRKNSVVYTQGQEGVVQQYEKSEDDLLPGQSPLY